MGVCLAGVPRADWVPLQAVWLGTALLGLQGWNKGALLVPSRFWKNSAFNDSVEFMACKLPILTGWFYFFPNFIFFFFKLSLRGICLNRFGTHRKGLSTPQSLDEVPAGLWHKPALVKQRDTGYRL